MMRKHILMALAIVGAWCGQAATEIAEIYTGDATTPSKTIMSLSGWNDGDLLTGAFGMSAQRERVVLLKNVTLGVNNTPMWGDTAYCPEVTFDLNGHSISATGEFCTSGFGIRALCNLTFIDSVGTGAISGKQVTCPKGVAVTFDLPMTSVVSADTGYWNYDPHDSGTKGSITIKGGKFDGCVHGSDSNGTTLLTGGFFNKTKNGSISSYDSSKSRYFDNGDGYWRVVSLDWSPSTISVPAVEHATAVVYTNGAGSVWCQVLSIGANTYEVVLGASVKVVYTAEKDYVFAGGGTTYETAFVANTETIAVTAPNEPIHLSGVTVNGLDVSALSGDGWEVEEALSGGFYTVMLTKAREYVLTGTNTNGNVRFDVDVAGATLIISNLVLSGYGNEFRSGIYLAPDAVIDLELKGVNAISGGYNRPAIEVSNGATIRIGGEGALAAFPGGTADPVGRYSDYPKGIISYSGGRYNFEVSEGQLASGYMLTAISETEGGYDFTYRVEPLKLGILVGGIDVGSGSGAGWTFANGVLSLTNAQDYVLAGTNTTGEVRVEVTANANVTLDNFELICDSATVDLLRFSGNDATLTLSGTSTVYAKNDYAAIQVANSAHLTVNGSGELVGGKSGSFCGRGVCVYNYGTLDWNGGTLRDYYFIKSGSTQEKGAGVYTMGNSVFNLNGGRLVGMHGYDGGAVYTQGGTVNIYGGDIAGNTANYGAALYCRGSINVYGGNITNNVAGGGIVCAGSGSLAVYGGIASGNSGDYLFYRDYGSGYLYGAVGADLKDAKPVSGKSVVKVTDTLYVVGENVTYADGQLTGGTFTFNPTNAEYVAAGLAVSEKVEIQRQEGTPVTYRLSWKTATVKVPTVADATAKVYTNEVEVVGEDGAYVVLLDASVKVVYTADEDYVFAGGGTTYETTFVANEDEITVADVPDEPVHLSGVTVNGLDVSALSGDGWSVEEAIYGGFYTVILTGAREFVINGTNINGNVRFDVWANGASIVASNLFLCGYGEYHRAGFYLAPGAVIDFELKGVNAIYGGNNRPAIEVSDGATIRIGGEGALAAFPGGTADPVGRHSGYPAGNISYSGGFYTFEVPEGQLAEGYVCREVSVIKGNYIFTYQVELLKLATVRPQEVANTTVKVYTNDVEVVGEEGAYVVALGTEVKVVYTVNEGYVFAGNATTAEATFTADAEEVTVPEAQLPAAPVEASVFVMQASGENVYVSSFSAAMNVATNGATITLLKDLADETLTETVSGFSYILDGDGHSLRLAENSAGQTFTVRSNEVVYVQNVIFDGAGLTNGLVSVLSGGRLTMMSCTVTGFVQPEGSIVSLAANGIVEGVTFTNNVCEALVSSSNERGADEAPILAGCVMKDNGDAENLRLIRGIGSVTKEIASGVLAIERGAMLAFSGITAPDAVTLNVPDAVTRIGEQLITNAYDVAVEAAAVSILVPGVRAVGTEGNIFLDSETNYLYAAAEASSFQAYRTFGEALDASAGQTVSLVHYRDTPNCIDIAEQSADLTVDVGSNVVLRTALRTIDGTETWNGATTEAVSLTGTLTVRGALTLQNVAVNGNIVLAGGTLTVDSDFALNDSEVLVTFADGFGPGGETAMTAITSSTYTGEELLKHFRLAADDLYFAATENGLLVIKATGQVARIGETWFDTFNAAVTAATNGEDTVAIVSVTNTATGEHREEVKFGADVTIGANERVLVKSIRTSGSGQVIESLEEEPTVQTVLMLDGGKVTLGAGATLAFTNVATTGALTLAGEGLLDLTNFTGTIQVRPTRTGQIAKNVTNQSVLQVAAGIEGELYYKGTEAWWKAGTFSAVFEQTGNGAGRITINDYGIEKTHSFSGETSGAHTYHYQDTTGLTDTDTNLTFGVVYCVNSDVQYAYVKLPSASLYATGDNYPMYKSSSGKWLSFDEDGRFTTDLPKGSGAGSDHMTPVELWVRNYNSVVKIAEFNIVATEQDAKEGMQEACEDDDTYKFLEAISDLTGGLLKVADIVAFVTGAVAEKYVGYTVVGWINAARSVGSCILRASCDAYVGDGEDDSDYYRASSIADAYDEAIDNNETVYIFESVGLPSYTLAAGDTLTLDAAGSPLYDTSALLAAIVGSIPKDPFAQMIVAEITGWVSEKMNKGVHELAEDRNPHAIWGTSASSPMITVSSGAMLYVSGIKEQYHDMSSALAQPLFTVSGTLSLDDTGKVYANDFSGLKGTGSAGLLHVCNGGKVYLNSQVTANTYGANFSVENGGLVILEKSGASSKVGISGQTGNSAVFSNTKATGAWAGTVSDYSAVFSNDAKPENCTLAIDSSNGNVYWNIPPTVYYLDLKDIPHYATYELAAADCAVAYVTRPNKAVEGVIGADAYDALFDVSVVNDGTASTPYTLKVDLAPSVSNVVQAAIDAALPSLAANVTNDTPKATISTQAGLYYGIPGAAAIEDIGAAVPSAWTLGTGATAQEVTGEKPDGATNGAFYRLRVTILP